MMNNFSNWGGGGQFFGLGLLSMAGIGLIALVIGVAIITLKGYALWTAAKRDEKWWFIILLVVNTIGILELVYLYFVAKKWQSDEKIVSGGQTGSSNGASSIPVSSPVSNNSSAGQTGGAENSNSTFVKQ